MPRTWIKRLVLGFSTGAIALQAFSCFDAFSAVANAITAGGVIYLVRRVID